jgi:hypothetical protein
MKKTTAGHEMVEGLGQEKKAANMRKRNNILPRVRPSSLKGKEGLLYRKRVLDCSKTLLLENLLKRTC